jgi:hypothetical protein
VGAFLPALLMAARGTEARIPLMVKQNPL